MPIPTYDEYIATLSRLTEHIDPATPTAESAAIKVAAESHATVSTLDRFKADLQDAARFKRLI